MTPDEMERLPAPMICRGCVEWEQFSYNNEPTRQHCRINKPQHESCPWFKPKMGSLVAERNRA